MWRSYLTVAVRALAKNRTFTFINIFGLALGLAVGLMILLYVRYELSYDRWLPEYQRAFQFQTFYHATEGGAEEMKLQLTSLAARRALVDDFPQIEESVHLIKGGAVVLQNGQMVLPEDLFLTDGNMFAILRFPFVRGDPRSALDAPNAIVLSESESRNRFGTIDSIGRTLTLISRGTRRQYVVTGVIRDPPGNSHIRPAMVARYDPAVFFGEYMPYMSDWFGETGWTYLRLRPGTDAEDINRQLPAWEKRNIPDRDTGGVMTNAGDAQDWKLVNVADVHLGEAQEGALTSGNDRRNVLTFAVIAALILGMAIANFTNLATARASQRAREVALRKVLGATRGQLVAQFVSESVLVTAMAMMVSLAMIELALPWFNAQLGMDIAISYWGRGGLLIPCLILVALVGLAGGAYPAFFLSRFRPTQVLKANKSIAEPEGSGRLRNLLVIAQFAVSIGLIVCTAVIYAQTVFARTSDAGYNRHGLIQINRAGAKQAEIVIDRLQDELARVPGVKSISRTSIRIDPANYSATLVRRRDSSKLIEIGYYGTDPNYLDTMGMKLLAGRGLSYAVARDDATTPFPVDPEAEREFIRRGTNVVMSEQAIYRLGFASPEEAIGGELLTRLSYPGFDLVPATIVGVVKDVRYRSVREPIQPIMYVYARNFHNTLMVRYEGVPAQALMSDLRKTWNRLVPGVPFDADLADDKIRELYQAEEARGRIFAAFAILAVIIACLGLFGLAAFTADRRTKEIGVRKVLGARTQDIVRLLAWQFSKPVIVANIIAWPIAWWVMRDWLKGFDASIVLGPAPFLIAAVLAVLIAIATIAGHAIKVARADPINALRYE